MNHDPTFHRTSKGESIGLTITLVLFAVFAILCWTASLSGAPLQRAACERDGSCWIDRQGYLHKSAVEPAPGCPDPSVAACAAYKQSLAWQQEAQNYPAVVKDSLATQTVPHLDGVTLPKLSRWQRFKAWWRRPCAYPWCWGVSREGKE